VKAKLTKNGKMTSTDEK